MNFSDQELKEMSYRRVLITANNEVIKRWWVIHDMDNKVKKAESDLANPENWSKNDN